MIDPDKISAIIRDVAHDKIVPRFQALAEGDIRSKSSPSDLVTIADEEAEIELTRIFKDMFPGCAVVGEEAVSSGTASRDILKDKSQMIWIVDPVDGTHNFAHGMPRFGTMVSLVMNGERAASWIYQIPRDRMVSAVKGEGVSIDGNAFTPPQKSTDDAAFETITGYMGMRFLPPKLRAYVERQANGLKKVLTHQCCAWEYVELLESGTSFSLYKRIEPWDHNAGALLLQEAGYYSRHWDGSAYEATNLNGGLINAPSEAIAQRIYDAFLAEPLRLQSQS